MWKMGRGAIKMVNAGKVMFKKKKKPVREVKVPTKRTVLHWEKKWGHKNLYLRKEASEESL